MCKNILLTELLTPPSYHQWNKNILYNCKMANFCTNWRFIGCKFKEAAASTGIIIFTINVQQYFLKLQFSIVFLSLKGPKFELEFHGMMPPTERHVQFANCHPAFPVEARGIVGHHHACHLESYFQT